jgi:hypothetical protein
MTFEAGNTMWPREELATEYLPSCSRERIQAAFEFKQPWSSSSLGGVCLLDLHVEPTQIL